MTKEYNHPMRDVFFHAYVRQDGAMAIARGHPYRLCPMIFDGETAEEALEAAEKFRAEAVEKNEATYRMRMKNLEAAQEAKKRKKRKKGENT